MNRHIAVVSAALVATISTTAAAQANAPVIGRWDLTVQGANGPYPSWVEVSLSGNRTLVGRFVAGGGSARVRDEVGACGGAAAGRGPAAARGRGGLDRKSVV